MAQWIVRASMKESIDGQEEGQEVLRHERRRPVWDSRRIPSAIHQETNAWETLLPPSKHSFRVP